jgi:LmbE family N-acetylglucosaminyl deacetylase
MMKTLTPGSLFWAATLLAGLSIAQDAPRDIPTGAALLKTDIMAVLAHPDDETMMASSIAYYAHVKEKSVAHVYCTRGEGGGNMVGTHWGPSLGVLREAELKRCLSTLGVAHCFFLDQVDWAYTESAAMTLEKWDHEAAVKRLTRYIRAMRPEVVLTMSPFPRPGWHGHHQAAGMLTVEATEAAADPARFPKQLSREGLFIWRVPKIYYRGSSDRATVASINARAVLPSGKSVHQIAGESLSNHRSQGFGRFARVNNIRPPETFVLLRSNVETSASEDDVFAGLAEGNPESEWRPARNSPPPPEIWFTPRPAITNFLVWAEKNQVRHLAGELKSDLPAAVGRTTPLELNIEIPSEAAGPIEISFELPGRASPVPNSISLEGTRRPSKVQVPLELTASTTEDFELRAIAREGAAIRATTSIKIHPIPVEVSNQTSIEKPRLTLSSDAVFVEATAFSIPHSSRVQGKSDSDADSSATIRVTQTELDFFVEVEVLDDSVVSNIAPNDIRGHWRSDAVEICIDPLGGKSEHTLSCYKLGVFPFDTEGNVRAARDADANQGPVEETSPGTRLFSEKMTDDEGHYIGYRVRVSIPWEEAGVNYSDTTEIGFNIIIYDGDKPDAALGENINESRIAWAPRSGVQGRPEDWGRLILSRAR